jgi:hypothetical protein
MIRTLLAALWLAAPAAADPSWAQFFDVPAAEVERTADGQREAVRLPGEIQIIRTREGEGWTYAGLDRSDHGAVGCVAAILVELVRPVEDCKGVFTDGERARLHSHLDRVAGFYAGNAVPATTKSAFLDRLAARTTSQGDALQCDALSDDFKPFARSFVGPDSEALIDDLLSVPRLPVLNPCL